MSDGMFHGRPYFAQRGVELGLAGLGVGAGESLVRHDVGAVDADVAQVAHCRVVGEPLDQAGLGVGVVSGRLPGSQPHVQQLLMRRDLLGEAGEDHHVGAGA